MSSHSKEYLAALERVVSNPVVTKHQLRKVVRQMVDDHLPEAYIRLFVGKVRLK